MESDPEDFNRNAVLHKNNEKSAQNCQNKLFRTLEINQRLTTIQEVFSQEEEKKKILNFPKSEVSGVFTVFYHFIIFNFTASLLPYQPWKIARIYGENLWPKPVKKAKRWQNIHSFLSKELL